MEAFYKTVGGVKALMEGPSLPLLFHIQGVIFSNLVGHHAIFLIASDRGSHMLVYCN